MSIVYSDMVAALAKKGEVIAAELTAEDAHLLHMVVGVSGEAGPGHATHEQLKDYLHRPPKMIEVKYRETTPDGALLFPVFVRVRDDK